VTVTHPAVPIPPEPVDEIALLKDRMASVEAEL